MNLFTAKNFLQIAEYILFTILLFLTFNSQINAQESSDTLSTSALKGLSLDQLMNVSITIVSRSPEQLFKTPASVYVISNDEIKNSGATNIVGALRLAPSVNVAQGNAGAWVVTTRGFSNIFANKLLVMIDGRVVYTPLYAGVIWDMQNVLLEDIEQIEIVSGPGASLWGSNAVNGVINIITKNSKDTQGLYVSAGGGTALQDFSAIRYGGKIGDNSYFRFYAQRYDYDNFTLTNGTANSDRWDYTQGGFRADFNPSGDNSFTLQGDLNGELARTLPTNSNSDGQNLMGKWTHSFSDSSNLKVKVYFDRTWIHDIPSTLSDQLTTYDLDFQHSFSLGKINNIVWGAGYRLMFDETPTTTIYVGFIPLKLTMPLYSAFAQDEVNIINQKLNLTVGTKLEHNVFTGFEWQPSVRLTYTPSDQQTIWSAVSRAVRTPSRFDVDYYIPKYIVPPPGLSIAGGPNFVSEKLIAYELGYRISPINQLSFSLSTFYNNYSDLYSVEALPGTNTYEIQNGSEGKSWGAELFADFQITNMWKLRGGYTFFRINLKPKPGHTYDPSVLADDPENMASLESSVNLLKDYQFDITAHYVSALPLNNAPSYVSLNARIARRFGNLELSIVGQNLLKKYHIEYGNVQIPRSVYGKISFSLY